MIMLLYYHISASPPTVLENNYKKYYLIIMWFEISIQRTTQQNENLTEKIRHLLFSEPTLCKC